MKTNASYRMIGRGLRAVLWAGLAALVPSSVWAQAGAGNPFNVAPSGALDTLSDSSVGPTGVGNIVKQRAQNVAQPNAAKPNAPPARAGANDNMARLRGGRPGAPNQLKSTAEAVTRVVIPRVKAIVGTRVFDSVTGELLDDAQLIMVNEADKGNYYDDGTHGDLVPDDKQFALVDTSRDYIGQSNQRLKERTIQAILGAEQLDPLEFFGLNLMTTERYNPPPRNTRWRMVADRKDSIGRRLAEVPLDAEKPLKVPQYREKEQERDDKIAGKDGWAVRFLDEYRKEKGKLDSEFYPVYIPMPPVPPFIQPPTSGGWSPFPHPEGPSPDKAGAGSGLSPYGYKLKGAPTVQGMGGAGVGSKTMGGGLPPAAGGYFNGNAARLGR